MALGAGDTVTIVASRTPGYGRATTPLLGTVESTNPWVVGWENGQRQSYAAVAPLNKVVNPVDTSYLSLLFKYVRSAQAIGTAQRYEGVVVAVFGLEDNAGAAQGDHVVIKNNAGEYVVALAATVELDPTR